MNKVNVLYGKDKSALQLARQAKGASKNQNVLITKLSEAKFGKLASSFQNAHVVNRVDDAVDLNDTWVYIKSCHVALFVHDEVPQIIQGIDVVTAGMGDFPVSDEVVATLLAYGYSPNILMDMGVNNLKKFLKRVDNSKAPHVIISVQGMEGALPVVLAGMTNVPIISVPTSTGYGLSKDGKVALDTSLASCTSGIACVNIDNGFGAALMAVEIMNQIQINVTKAV